jgi:hypothetical protein
VVTAGLFLRWTFVLLIQKKYQNSLDLIKIRPSKISPVTICDITASSSPSLKLLLRGNIVQCVHVCKLFLFYPIQPGLPRVFAFMIRCEDIYLELDFNFFVSFFFLILIFYKS